MGNLRYGDYRLRTRAGRALSFLCSTGLCRAKIEQWVDYERRERETTQLLPQILPYLGKQLRRVKLVNKGLVAQFLFFRPWILKANIKEINLNRNSNGSFIRFIRWTPPITDVVWSIKMPSFDYLKDVYIIFIQKMPNKNSHKKGYTSRKTHQSFRTNFETFKVRKGKRLPTWFLFSAVNLNSAYTEVYVVNVLDKIVVTTISGSSMLKA